MANHGEKERKTVTNWFKFLKEVVESKATTDHEWNWRMVAQPGPIRCSRLRANNRSDSSHTTSDHTRMKLIDI